MLCSGNTYVIVNALICFILYVYIWWGMIVIRYPAYQPTNCCESMNLFIRQLVLGVLLFVCMPYIANTLMTTAYAYTDYICL
jgi:hypothetical protein